MKVKPLLHRSDDEGELHIVLTLDADHLLVDFGKAVHWFALPRKAAVELALRIMRLCADKHLSIGSKDTAQ